MKCEKEQADTRTYIYFEEDGKIEKEIDLRTKYYQHKIDFLDNFLQDNKKLNNINIDPHAELRRDLRGYRLTFKYADGNDKPTALNECSANCCNNAAWFCHEFFSMKGLWENCFPNFTKVQTYRYRSATYPTPFNGMNGGVFEDDTEHSGNMTLVSTCSVMPEAVHEISTVCKESFDKLAQYAKEFEKTHADVHVQFLIQK